MRYVILRHFAAALCLLIIGCVVCGRPERAEIMRKPRDIPEQRIAGEPGATGEYVRARRQEFKACLKEVFLEVSQRALAGEDDIAQQVTKKALACHERFFRVMKGGTNIDREDVRRAMLAEERRQRNFYCHLRRLAERFASRGVRFEIAEAGSFADQTLWEWRLMAGCRIETDNGVSLFACPLQSLRTSEYMVPRAGPIAAQLLFLDADGMIFIQQGEEPGDAFVAAAGEFFGGFRDVADEIAGIHLARLYDHHLEISVVQEMSLSQLEELRTQYQVLAVYKGDPHDFTALISLGPEDDLPRLLRELRDW